MVERVNRFSAANSEYNVSSTGSYSEKFRTLKQQVEDVKNKTLDPIQEDVDTSYNVTDGGDGDGDGGSGVSTAETIIGAITAFGSAAAQVMQSLGGSGQLFNTNPGETKSSSGLDKATADYQKDPSPKNERTLKISLDKATFDKGTLDNQIKKISGQESALQKAAEGNFDAIIDNIQDGINTTQKTIVDNNEKASKLNEGIGNFTKGLEETSTQQVSAEELQNQFGDIFKEYSGQVDIKLTEEAKEKETLANVGAKVNEYNGKVNEDEVQIQKCTSDLGTKKNDLAEKTNALASARNKLGNTDEYIDKPIEGQPGKTERVKNEEYGPAKQAVKDAEKELKEAQKAVEKAEKDLADAREQKDKDYAKLMEYSSLIKIGETNLADIVQQKNEAENQRDRAQLEQQDYASQAIALGAKKEDITEILGNLNGEYNNNKLEVKDNQADLGKLKDALGDAEGDKKAAGQRVAIQQLEFGKYALSELTTASNRLGTSISNAQTALASNAGAPAQPAGGKSAKTATQAPTASNPTQPTQSQGQEYIINWNELKQEAWNPIGFGGNEDSDYEKFAKNYRDKEGSIIDESVIKRAYEEQKNKGASNV